jgi:hypothetical protein
VQRRGNGRRQQVPSHHSGYSQRQQCLKTPERYEPEKHADRRAQRDRVTGIFKLQELSTLFAKPSKRVHWIEVIGLVSAREHRICLVVTCCEPNRSSALGDNYHERLFSVYPDPQAVPGLLDQMFGRTSGTSGQPNKRGLAGR